MLTCDFYYLFLLFIYLDPLPCVQEIKMEGRNFRLGRTVDTT